MNVIENHITPHASEVKKLETLLKLNLMEILQPVGNDLLINDKQTRLLMKKRAEFALKGQKEFVHTYEVLCNSNNNPPATIAQNKFMMTFFVTFKDYPDILCAFSLDIKNTE